MATHGGLTGCSQEGAQDTLLIRHSRQAARQQISAERRYMTNSERSMLSLDRLQNSVLHVERT